ncbi:predicted protein [Chaetoceros tenuissimus]|uniref:Uncharacterized protein n=1 Tax=Chaetoceros tenuissimus TaxID=426638 RepID=A0AAD3D7E3_9STRA|nr:predicted protein [Chaetoceros tenuissimus]
MGNDIKTGMAVAKAKKKAGKVLTVFDDKPAKKREIIENPENRRERNKRHNLRDKEFKEKQQERKKKKASITEKWVQSQNDTRRK